MQKIIDNYAMINDRVRLAEKEFGREPESVTIIGVTKKQPIGKLLTAAQEGLLNFGESHIQEAIAKRSRLKEYDITWHLLGPIQSNKTAPVAEYFDWVHSVDRAKIALRLSQQRPEGTEPINILLQVNVDDEDTKAGLAFEELPMVAQFVRDLPGVKLRGLSAIPKLRHDFEDQRIPFRKLREAMEQLNADGYNLDVLSMGMSHDFEAAIAEGATVIRIGTAIFGSRGI